MPLPPLCAPLALVGRRARRRLGAHDCTLTDLTVQHVAANLLIDYDSGG